MRASASNGQQPPHGGWLLAPPRATASAIRLYCLPYAGAGASTYMAWSARLPGTVEVRGVQLPGRENRFSIPPFRRMDALVAAAADALAGSLDPPYAMFGCSLGALVAFELVSLLHQRSRPLPVHLFVASCAAPHTFHGFPAFSQLDDALLLAALEQRYGSLGLDALREPELRAFILPALRADLETIETYRYCPRPPLPCPITAFVGQDDHGLALVDTERWGDLTTDGFEVQTLPGGHFLPRECLSEVTDAIVEVLARS